MPPENEKEKHRTGGLPGEIPIRSHIARRKLGMGASRFSGIKKLMGISHRRFVYMSAITNWLSDHPDYTEAQVYARSRQSVCAVG